MFGRVALRATQAARTAGAPTKVTRAAFSAGAKLREYEGISEKEISAVSFEGGAVKPSTLIVGEKTEHDASRVVPLTQEMYKKLNPTLQKGSIFGKVVIVTGYVPMFPSIQSEPI